MQEHTRKTVVELARKGHKRLFVSEPSEEDLETFARELQRVPDPVELKLFLDVWHEEARQWKVLLTTMRSPEPSGLDEQDLTANMRKQWEDEGGVAPWSSFRLRYSGSILRALAVDASELAEPVLASDMQDLAARCEAVADDEERMDRVRRDRYERIWGRLLRWADEHGVEKPEDLERVVRLHAPSTFYILLKDLFVDMGRFPKPEAAEEDAEAARWICVDLTPANGNPFKEPNKFKFLVLDAEKQPDLDAIVRHLADVERSSCTPAEKKLLRETLLDVAARAQETDAFQVAGEPNPLTTDVVLATFIKVVKLAGAPVSRAALVVGLRMEHLGRSFGAATGAAVVLIRRTYTKWEHSVAVRWCLYAVVLLATVGVAAWRYGIR